MNEQEKKLYDGLCQVAMDCSGLDAVLKSFGTTPSEALAVVKKATDDPLRDFLEGLLKKRV